jgi:hypothetical protein
VRLLAVSLVVTCAVPTPLLVTASFAAVGAPTPGFDLRLCGRRQRCEQRHGRSGRQQIRAHFAARRLTSRLNACDHEPVPTW